MQYKLQMKYALIQRECDISLENKLLIHNVTEQNRHQV